MKHIGIDYGSKLAGTTVICFVDNKKLCFEQSIKQKDADAFVTDWIKKNQPSAVYMDAPLSLPNAYFDKGDDFFFRECDRTLKAMSPMFLGGLTARAMQLQQKLSSTQMPFYETYPAALAKLLSNEVDRKWKQSHENFEPFYKLLLEYLPLNFKTKPDNWHQIDSALAWLSGHRHQSDTATISGDEKEGVIIV